VWSAEIDAIALRFLPPGSESFREGGGLFFEATEPKGWLRIGAIDMDISSWVTAGHEQIGEH
jgi:hypothetical protein